MKSQSIFVSYLLLPIISFFLGLAVVILKKRNTLINNKNLITLCLLYSLLIALPGIFSLSDESFPKIYYNVMQVIYFLLGFVYIKKITAILKNEKEYIVKAMIILTTLLILCIGSYIFSIVFNYFGKMNYGLIASTCTYTLFIPVFITWSYKSSLQIPSPILKIWKYDPSKKEINYSSDTTEEIIILEIELSKNISDEELVKVKAKAPLNYKFGDWFQLFIDDHNTKYSESPINYFDLDNKLDDWIFYTKQSLLKNKKIIDFEKTIEENNLKNDSPTIVCKRVNFSYN